MKWFILVLFSFLVGCNYTPVNFKMIEWGNQVCEQNNGLNYIKSEFVLDNNLEVTVVCSNSAIFKSAFTKEGKQ